MKYRVICLLLLTIPFFAILAYSGSVKEASETQLMAVIPFLFSLRSFITALKVPNKNNLLKFTANWFAALLAFAVIGLIAVMVAASNMAF